MVNIDFRNPDWDRDAAEALVNACNGIGLQARLHWDRSPWCCQVALVKTAADWFDERTPSIYFMLEDGDSYFIMGHGDNSDKRLGVRWRGAISLGEGVDDDIHDLSLEVLQRDWLGDTVEDTARRIALICSIIDVSALQATTA